MRLVKTTSLKIINIFIKNQEIQTHVWSIYEEIQSEYSYASDKANFDNSVPNPERSLIDINLYASNQKFIYKRKYVKIQLYLLISEDSQKPLW